MTRTPFDSSPETHRALPEYRVRESPRARHVNLTVSPIDGLVVVIPRGFDERLIPGLIHNQRNWIKTRLSQFSHITNFDEHWQRPVQVSLPATKECWTIEYRANESATVRILTRDDGTLLATGAVENRARLHTALKRWLKRRAQLWLPVRVTELADLHGFNISRVTIRHQRSRWGSYSTSGAISLNARLMFVSPKLVDHVLLHELCHTVHAHHGPAFHELLAGLMPNYRGQRAELRAAWTDIPAWMVR